MLSIDRSKSIWGRYESYAGNPLSSAELRANTFETLGSVSSYETKVGNGGW